MTSVPVATLPFGLLLVLLSSGVTWGWIPMEQCFLRQSDVLPDTSLREKALRLEWAAGLGLLTSAAGGILGDFLLDRTSVPTTNVIGGLLFIAGCCCLGWNLSIIAGLSLCRPFPFYTDFRILHLLLILWSLLARAVALSRLHSCLAAVFGSSGAAWLYTSLALL